MFEQADPGARLEGERGRLGGAGRATRPDAADPAVPGDHLARLPGGAARGVGAIRRGPRAGVRGRATRSVSTPRWSPPASWLAPDAIRLVARRGELMGAAQVDGGMAAVIGLDRDAVAGAIAAVASPADLVVANDNAPGQVVISGTRDALTRAEEALQGGRRPPRDRAAGLRPVPLAAGWRRSATRWPRPSTTWPGRTRRRPWSATSPPNRSPTPSASANLLAEQVRSPVEWVR